MSLPRFEIIVIDAPDTPGTYILKYVMMRILFTLIFGVIMMMSAPTWAYGLMLLSQDANTWLTRLWDLTHFYDRLPISSLLFDNPFASLMLLLNLIPWAIFIPIVEGVANKYVAAPKRNTLAVTEVFIVKFFTYLVWTLLICTICMLALGLHVIFDRLESITMFQEFFGTFGRAIQMGIFLSYGSIILFNAYHNAKFLPPDEHSPIRSLHDTVKEITARKWEAVEEDDEFQTIKREEIIYQHAPSPEADEEKGEEVKTDTPEENPLNNSIGVVSP